MLLLIDEDIPDSVAQFLRERGHDIRLVRDLLMPGTPDEVIAAAGDTMGAIVVTSNARHFRKLIERRPLAGHIRFSKVGRICLACPQTQARARIEQLIESIEFEYQQLQKQRDQRLIIDITQTTFRVTR